MPSQESRAPQRPSFRYIDRPEISETFADTIESAFFDGQTLQRQPLRSTTNHLRSLLFHQLRQSI
jgi:hypothetical protein